MTFLLFQLGKDRYALEARRVAEVLPPVALKKIPAAAPGIAGVLNYHGSPVPVVDLGAMALGQPARARLSTRILLVRYAAGTGPEQFLGLLAEQATETLRREPADFQPAGVTSPDTPFLGPVTTDSRGLIQRVELEQLLTPAAREQLWQTAAALA
jgi:chemotaxis-related protein WspB